MNIPDPHTILTVFNDAADLLIGDYMQSEDWDDTVAEMPRSFVAKQLSNVDLPKAKIVANWINENKDWWDFCDSISVPIAWTP